MRSRQSEWIAVAVSAIASFTMTSMASGANLKATPSLAIHGVYDSNLFSTPTNEISDFYIKAVPALKLSLELPATSVDLNGSFEIDRYASHDELDSSKSTVNLGLLVSKPIQVSPRFSIAPTARYLETKDTYRSTQLSQSPIPGLPPSDTLVVGRTSTRDTAASLQMTYLLTPNLDLGFGGAFTKRDFLDERPGFIDSETFTGNASVGVRVSPRFTFGPFINASRIRYEDDRKTETYGGGALFTYLAGPHFSLTSHLGANYLRDFGPGGVLLDETWVPIGDITGRYVSGNFTGTLGVFYMPAGGGTFGVTTKRGAVIATATSKFTERWDWSLSATYQTNVAASGPSNADYSTFEFDAGMGYQVARWARLKISGTLFRQWADPPFGADISRETVFAGIDVFTTYSIF